MKFGEASLTAETAALIPDGSRGSLPQIKLLKHCNASRSSQNWTWLLLKTVAPLDAKKLGAALRV